MSGKTSPWVYVAIGCGVLAVAAVACSVAGGLVLFRGAKRIEQQIKDPATREAKVREILGADTLPGGYHPWMGMSIPFVMEFAILSDREFREDEADLGERGLIYVRMPSLGQNEQELRDYFEGRTSDPRVLRDNNIHVDPDEVIRRGAFPLGEATMLYVAQRGSVSTQGMRGTGITSVILIDCPTDRKMRTAIWFGPDPDPDTPVDRFDVTGTPADEAAMAAFMGHFRLCPS